MQDMLSTLPSTNFLVVVVATLSGLAVLTDVFLIVVSHISQTLFPFADDPEVQMGRVYTFLGTLWGFVVVQFGAKRMTNRPGMGDEGNNPSTATTHGEP